MERPDYDDPAVFEEVKPLTPATSRLVQHFIEVAARAGEAANELNQTINELVRTQEELAAVAAAARPKRTGHGPILYTDEQLLADIDAVLNDAAPWHHPNVDYVCSQLRGRGGPGMAQSTLRENLRRMHLIEKGGLTLKAWLIERKNYLDEKRGFATRLFSHLAAAVVLIATCLGKIDPANVRRLLLID